MIPAADQAIGDGAPDALVELLEHELETEIRARFSHMLQLQARADGDLEANRTHVDAMLGPEVWAHSLHEAIHGRPHEHAQRARQRSHVTIT